MADPHYSLDFAPTYTSFAVKVEGAAGWPRTDPGEPHEDLGRGQQNFAAAFRRSLERGQTCVRMAVAKSRKAKK